MIDRVRRREFVGQVLASGAGNEVNCNYNVVVIFQGLHGTLRAQGCQFKDVVTTPSQGTAMVFLGSPFGQVTSVELNGYSFGNGVPFATRVDIMPVFAGCLYSYEVPIQCLSSMSQAVFVRDDRPTRACFILVSAYRRDHPTKTATSHVFGLARACPIFHRGVGV